MCQPSPSTRLAMHGWPPKLLCFHPWCPNTTTSQACLLLQHAGQQPAGAKQLVSSILLRQGAPQLQAWHGHYQLSLAVDRS